MRSFRLRAQTCSRSGRNLHLHVVVRTRHSAEGLSRRRWQVVNIRDLGKEHFKRWRADYQSQHEPILYGWKDGADHFWCGARGQRDAWFIDKPAKNELHPTMKPVALVERAIQNSSKSRDMALDLFGGSGTTMIAADRTVRRARLLELDPKYVNGIVQRWEKVANCKA